MHNDRSRLPVFLSLGVCAALLLLPTVAQAQSAEPPPVTVDSQPDAPLHITAATAQWTERQMLRLTVSFKNVSPRPVRVSTVRFEPVSQEGAFGGAGCLRSNIVAPGDEVQHGQARSVEIGDLGYGRPITEIRVAIDFAEHSDDSVWGPDLCESAQRLAGERAGGRKALNYLRTVLDEHGARALPKASRAARSRLAAPGQYTVAWRDGYANGVTTICARVRDALKEGGLPQAEAALQAPYDASGE